MKEHFDDTAIQSDVYNKAVEFGIGTIQNLRKFVRDLDTPNNKLTLDILNNRIEILRSVKVYLELPSSVAFIDSLKDDIRNNIILLNKEIQGTTTTTNTTTTNTTTTTKDLQTKYIKDLTNLQMLRFVFENSDAFVTFIITIIEMVIIHSEELRQQITNGGSNIEFFSTITITNEITSDQKEAIGKIISRFGLSFDELMKTIEKFDVKTSELNSSDKILRLRTLNVFRQILSLVSIDGFTRLYVNINEDNLSRYSTFIKLGEIYHYILTYIVDLYLKDIYINLDSSEIKTGVFYEKFIKYYPKEVDSLRSSLIDKDVSIKDLEAKILECRSTIKSADSLIIGSRNSADQKIADAIKKANDDAQSQIKRANDDAQIQIKRANDDAQSKVKDTEEKISSSQRNVQIMAVLLVILLLSCSILGIMYIVKK